MSFRLSRNAVLLLALSLGCAATHHPAPTPAPAQSAGLRAQFAGWRVGVRAPEVRYVDPDAPRPDVLDEVRDAGRLIAALRRTQLFEDVNFTHALACEPNLELVVRAHDGDPIGSAPLWLLPLTLSIAIITDEDGVVFSPASDPEAVFALPYPTTLVVGILPLLASPVLVTGAVPGWSLLDDGAPDEQLAHFLLANAERLQRFALESTSCGDSGHGSP